MSTKLVNKIYCRHNISLFSVLLFLSYLSLEIVACHLLCWEISGHKPYGPIKVSTDSSLGIAVLMRVTRLKSRFNRSIQLVVYIIDVFLGDS